MNSILIEYGLPIIALVVSIVVLTLQIKNHTRHMKEMMEKDEDYASFLEWKDKKKKER